MKIDILTVTGSPMEVTEETIYGDGVQLGVGGAELGLLTMCRAWHEKGYDVTLYNNPRKIGASVFKQKSILEFNGQEDRDILIYFRGPNIYGASAKGKKIWWSCDQYTVGDYAEFSKECDDIVVISPFHGSYFYKTYGIKTSKVIDIPVRESDYENVNIEKNMKQVLFCSVPDRGLEQLAPIWRKITEEVPDAQLHITSDWRLWNPTLSTNLVTKYRMLFVEFDNVHYHSLVDRTKLIQLQSESAIHLYPCVYDELFCIAVAETQYAGCYPITTTTGALATTNMGSFGGFDSLSDITIKMLNNPDLLRQKQEEIKLKARERFSIKEALKQWDEIFYGSLISPHTEVDMQQSVNQSVMP